MSIIKIQDNLITGLVLGILIPLLVYLIMFGLNTASASMMAGAKGPLANSTMQLIGIFCNMFLLRFFLHKKEYDKTGRGIMLATFVIAAGWIILHNDLIFG